MLAPIVPSDKFERDVANLRGDYPQIDDVVSAARWALIRAPHLGQQVKENRYIFLTSPFEFTTPVFRILYKFSETNQGTIVLLAIGSSTQD